MIQRNISLGQGNHSVMDMHSLWDDDPEELLLELGFGCDEPDLSGRIPSRFINYQSQARGIDLQVFLKAQQDRLDLENPDVSNRFRQLEVLQQVTTAFSSLVGASPSSLREQSAEAQTRRRYFAMVFRRASKKSIRHTSRQTGQNPTTPSANSPDCIAPESLQHMASYRDRNCLKRGKSGPLDTTPLSPLPEEKGVGPGAHFPHNMDPSVSQEEVLRPASRTATRFILRRKRPRQSFEMEEIHSFDGSSGNGAMAEGSENLVQRNIRTNSCQSDSSGFFEEPFIPSNPQMVSPGSQLIKALSTLPGRSFDSLCCEKTRCSPITLHISPSPLHAFLPQCFTSSSVDESLPPSSSPSRNAPIDLPLFHTPPNQDQAPHHELVDTDGSSPGPLHPPGHSEGTTCFTISSICPQNSDHPFEPNVDSQFYLCTATSYPSTDFPENLLNSQSESTENPIPASHSFLPLSVTSPNVPTFALHKYLPSLNFSSVGDSISHQQQHSQEELLSVDPDKLDTSHLEGMMSEQEDEDTSFSFWLDKGGWSSLSSQSHDQDGFIDLFVQRGVDNIKQHQKLLSELDRQSTCGNKSGSASPVQDFIYVEMEHIPLDIEVTLKMKEEKEADNEKVQTKRGVVCISHPEGILPVSEEEGCQTERDEIVSSGCSVSEFSPKAQQETTNSCQMGSDGTQSDPPGSGPKTHDHVPATKYELKTSHLMETESLDVAFETSVDGSDSEGEDVQAFFQQLDDEGRVYWAEPVQVSNLLLVPKESSTVDTPHKSKELLTDQTAGHETASPDTQIFMAVDSTMSHSASSNTKPPCPSVSVQMSSGLSSHIVHRKDVPYMTKSQQNTLSSMLPLDTTTPFRAVQSWTDRHIQWNLAKKFSHRNFDTFRDISKSATEITQKPVMFSPSASFPLLCIDWQSHEMLPETVSVDTGLWPDEQDSMEGNENKEHFLCKHTKIAKVSCSCSSCAHQCFCCTDKCQHIRNSSEELPNTRLHLQHFRLVLCDMEEQLSEDQAAVFSSLSIPDRELLQDIEELRRVVKQEAMHLESQLDEFTLHHPESFKTNLHRLLEEQSSLCSELRVCLPGTIRISTSLLPSRTVATQCCLSPQLSSSDLHCGQV